jgi:hypothetical protein
LNIDDDDDDDDDDDNVDDDFICLLLPDIFRAEEHVVIMATVG